MSDDLLESIEMMVEERLRQGEGLPEGAGVRCDLCGWEEEVPWALRERLEAMVDEHAQTVHPDLWASNGPEDEDEDEDDEEDDD